jgi:acyl-CoA synthetase (AMP-forming)/AMP-acid ligase II
MYKAKAGDPPPTENCGSSHTDNSDSRHTDDSGSSPSENSGSSQDRLDTDIAYAKVHGGEVPKQIHVTDTIPRTATGKIQRRNVAQAYAQKTS